MRSRRIRGPHYHGWWAFLLATLPATLLILVWAIGQSTYIDRHISAQVQDDASDPTASSHGLSLSLIKSLAYGLRKLDSEDARQPAEDLRRAAAAACRQGRRAGNRHQGLHDPGGGRGEPAAGPARLDRRHPGAAAGDRRRRLRRQPGAAARAGPQQRRTADAVGTARRLDHRHRHDHRHRAVDAVPDDQLLRAACRRRLLLRHGLGSALRRCRRRRDGGPVRPDSAACRHALHRARGDAGRRAGRPDVGRLHGRIRLAAGSLGGQAGARAAGRHPDHRLRHLRAGDARTVPARPQRRARRRHRPSSRRRAS